MRPVRFIAGSGITGSRSQPGPADGMRDLGSR